MPCQQIPKRLVFPQRFLTNSKYHVRDVWHGIYFQYFPLRNTNTSCLWATLQTSLRCCRMVRKRNNCTVCATQWHTHILIRPRCRSQLFLNCWISKKNFLERAQENIMPISGQISTGLYFPAKWAVLQSHSPAKILFFNMYILYPYTCMCTYAYVHTYMHACTYTYGYMKAWMHAHSLRVAYMHAYNQLGTRWILFFYRYTRTCMQYRISRNTTHTCIHTHTHACIHIHMHTYTYTCIHTHTHAYIHIHMHTYT